MTTTFATLPRRYYVDDTDFEGEMQRIWYEHRLYLAYESELPNAGDFVVRELLGESIIVTRGGDGDVNEVAYVWEQTTLQDIGLIERAQAGVKSRRFEPGPLSSEHEPDIASSLSTYLQACGECVEPIDLDDASWLGEGTHPGGRHAPHRSARCPRPDRFSGCCRAHHSGKCG